MKSQDIFSAIESIDSELLYDARAHRSPKIYLIRRTAVAAAVVITLFLSILIYANFVMPVSTVSIESNMCITLSINARGNVLSTVSDHREFSSVEGKPADEAVGIIVSHMIEKGELSDIENTLLIGADPSRQTNVEEIVQNVFNVYHFHGCIVNVAMEKETFQKEIRSPAKTALIEILTKNSDCFTYDSLTDLSVNDLHLLVRETHITDDRLRTSAEPSQKKYISRKAACQNAIKLSVLSPVDSVEAQLCVYHRRLAYLVTLRSGENAEMYFISATDGINEHTIRTTAAQAPQMAQDAVRSSNITSQENPPASSSPAVHQDIVPDSTQEENIITPSPAVSPLPTETATEPAESEEYTEVILTMRELSFTTMTPPSSADSVSYRTLFEGQVIENRSDGKKNEGVICVITNLSQWNKFLSENNKMYTDQSGNACRGFSKDYFDTHSLLVSACVFSDASYYTTVEGIDADGNALYIDDTLSYGEQRSGEFYCCTLSVYELDKESISSDMTLNVY